MLFHRTASSYIACPADWYLHCCHFACLFQGIFATWYLPGIGWVPMIGTLFWLLPYTEYTKRQVRTNPDGWWARKMAW